MKLSEVKWWHWTLLTIAAAAAIRVATGGPLPFVGRIGAPGAPAGPSPTAGRPARQAGEGPSLTEAVSAPGMKIDKAVPELHRLTIEATVENGADGPALVDRTGAVVERIAQALQKGVKEDSSDVLEVRLLVATKGDAPGQSHLALYSLSYAAKSLFAMAPGLTPAEALAPATGVVFNRAAAHKAMRDWCANSDNLNQAITFCGKVTASKGV